MISILLVGIAAGLVLAILVLLGILATATRIDDNVRAATDNVHRIRARLERDGHRIQDLLAAAERIDANVGDFHRAEKRRRPSEF